MCYDEPPRRKRAPTEKKEAPEAALHGRDFITRDGSVVHVVYDKDAVAKGCDPLKFTVTQERPADKKGNKKAAKQERYAVGYVGYYKSAMGHVLCVGEPENIDPKNPKCDLHALDMVKPYNPNAQPALPDKKAPKAKAKAKTQKKGLPAKKSKK